MTLTEELKALDIASNNPNNIYKRVLEYIEQIQRNDIYRNALIKLGYSEDDI